MSEFPKIDIATQFHRNNAVPLDSTEIFDNLPAATDYATNNGTAYTGQIITVVDNNSISAFQITSEKKLDPILTETNTSSKFSEISTDFEKIENLIADLSSETSGDIYTINNKIKELSGIVNKNIDFIQAISVDLSDDISNIVEFNKKISTINKNLDELSGKHKDDIEEVSKKITDISGEIDYIYSDLSSKIDGNTTLIDELSSVLDDLSDVFSINNVELKEKIIDLSEKHKNDIEDLLSSLEETNNIISELSGEHKDDIDKLLSNLEITNDSIAELSVLHKKDIDKLSFNLKETDAYLSGRIESLYDFIQVVSNDLSDDISNIVDFNNKIFTLNKNLDELSDLHKEDIKELLSEIKETNDIISELSGKHGLEIETLEKDISELSIEVNNIEKQVNNLSTDFIFENAWRSKPTIIIGKNIDPGLSSDSRNSIMIGTSATAPASEAIAIGNSAKATGSGTIAIGKEANKEIDNKTPENAIAIGTNSRAKNEGTIAIGNAAWTGSTNSSDAIAIGTSTTSRGSGSIVIGKDAEIINTSNNSIAIGVNAKISGANISDAIQLGTGTNTERGTLQFRNYPLVDNNGKIFEERIPDQISANINKLSNSVNELSTTTFEAISKNTELINNFSDEIKLSIDELNKEIDNISSQHEIDFENLLSKTEDLNNKIDSISSEFSNEISDINSSIINIFDELISNTNNINELSDSISCLNANIDELSDSFETFENELSNKVPEYETDPIFTKWKDSSSICLGKDAIIDDEEKSVSIAIGMSAASNNNSIAIGRKSNAEGLNRVAIGSNSDANGFNSVAIGTGSVASKYSTAIGHSAKVKNSNLNYLDTHSIAIGCDAVVSNAVSAVQIGPGTNIASGTFQFKDFQLVDVDGQIPFERLKNFSTKSAIDYTAFEVWITSADISAGTIISPSNQFEDFTVKETISAGYIHTTILWSYKDLGKNPSLEDLSGFNIIIDWGDGTTESLDEIPTLDLETTYTANWNSKENKYIIKRDKTTVSARVTSPKLSENSNLLSSIEDGFSFLEEKLSTVHSLKEIHPNVSEFNYKKENGSATGIFISHKYKNTGRYIVKIFGTDYFGIAHGTDWNLRNSIITNNIFTPPFNVGEDEITLNGASVSDQCPFSYENVRLSRCFDQDLPISKNVTSLNSFAGINNVCLFKINIPMYYNWVNAKDMAGIFKENKNLQYVVGAGVQNIFAESFTNIDIKGIFYKTNNLISTNVRLPNYSTNLIHNGKKQSWFDYYNWTDAQNSLQIDILDILPQDKVVDKLVRVGNLFKDFSKITCSDYNKLAQHLWGDNTVEWENIENTFSGSSLDLNRIPVSWGGNFDWDDKMYRLYNDLDEDAVTIYSLNEYLNDFKSIISCLYDGKFSNENISCLNEIDSDNNDLTIIMTDINTMSDVLSEICLKKYIKVDNLDLENSSISDITRAINKFKKILF